MMWNTVLSLILKRRIFEILHHFHSFLLSLHSSMQTNHFDMSDAPELKTYNGNCHCGAFKYFIRVPVITSVTQCNCSICFTKGYRWVFPAQDCFEVIKGEGMLREYHFGQRTMVHRVISLYLYLHHHLYFGRNDIYWFSFVQRVGLGYRVSAIILQREGMLVSMWVGECRIYHWNQWLMMIHRSIPSKISTNGPWQSTSKYYPIISFIYSKCSPRTSRYDGLDREPQYIAPQHTGKLPKAEFENEKLYTGACHCGAVTIAFKAQAPLPEGKEFIQECNCSICSRVRTVQFTPPNVFHHHSWINRVEPSSVIRAKTK